MKIKTLQAILVSHREDIYRFVRFLGVQPADADDLVQETFLAAFSSRSLPASEDSAEWGRWLRGIARNMFLRLCRKKEKMYTLPDPAELEKDEQFWDTEFSPDPDASLHIKALRTCLEKLSGRERKAVDMRYRDGISRKAMAEQLGLSADGVKSLLRKIRSSLGDCIKHGLGKGTE